MKVLAAKVNWLEKYANRPEFQILVDKIPDYNEIIHHRVDTKDSNVFYYYEKDGYVSFFCNPDGQGACGGKIYSYGGTIKHIGGAWSSRAGCINVLGIGQVADVAITDNLESFKRGYTFMAGHVTLDLLKEAVRLACFQLAKVYNKTNDEYHYEPVQNDGTIKMANDMGKVEIL